MGTRIPKQNHPFVSLGDSPALDAFSRIRVSDGVTLFDSQLQYGVSSLVWDQTLVGTGAVTHLPNESSVRLDVLASGDSVVRQTRQYHHYQPGKSQVIACTFTLGAPAENVERRVGYFDAQNGIFLVQRESGLSIVRRSYASGAAVDVEIANADWNIDRMDGTTQSGIRIDPTKANILVIDLQWLGVGRVRVGFDIDGLVFYAHEFFNANANASVYMTTANLPVRYEIRATGAIAATHSLLQICCMVASEGGFDAERGYPRTVGNGITSIAVTTRRPVISIRPKATFNSITNRGLIIPEAVELYASGNPAFWELVYGGALATTPSWASVGTNSIVEYDIGATVITGGDVIASGFVPASAATRAATSEQIVSRLPLTLDIAGANPIGLSLAVTSFSGTSTVSGAINWREIF